MSGLDASSLFGPSDASSDPFGAIGDQEQVPTQQSHSANPTSDASRDIADVFGLSADDTRGVPAQEAPQQQGNASWVDAPTQNAYDGAQHYAYPGPAGSAGYPSQQTRSAYDGLPVTSAYPGGSLVRFLARHAEILN